MRKIYLYLLFFISFSFSQQDLKMVFKAELELNQSNVNLDIENILEDAAEIHPELIYYAIERINKNDTQGVTAMDYQRMRSWYGKNKNHWLTNQIQYASRKEFPEEMKKKASAIFNKYWVRGFNMYQSYPRPVVENPQKTAYIVNKYYKKDSALTFSPDTDYNSEIMKYEDEKFTKIALILNKNVTTPDIKEDEIRLFTKNWYILNQTKYKNSARKPADYVTVTLSNDPDFIVEIESMKRPWINLSVEIGYSFNKPYPINFTIHEPGFKTSVSFSDEFATDGLFASLNYTYNITKKPGIFKYIRGGINYMTGEGGSKDYFVDLQRTEYTEGTTTIVESYRVPKYTHSLKSATSIGGFVATPLYFFSSNLSIEVQAGYDQITYTKTVKYRYSYTRTVGLSTTNGARSRDDEVKESINRFLGGLGLRYVIAKLVTINAFVNQEYAGFTIGVII